LLWAVFVNIAPLPDAAKPKPHLEAAAGIKPAKVRKKDLLPLPELADWSVRSAKSCGGFWLIRCELSQSTRIIAIDQRAKGLRRFLLSPDVLAREDDGTLSSVEPAERLGVKQEVAYQWVRVGLLPTVDVVIDRRNARGLMVWCLKNLER
jgi:hypothetical protein